MKHTNNANCISTSKINDNINHGKKKSKEIPSLSEVRRCRETPLCKYVSVVFNKDKQTHTFIDDFSPYVRFHCSSSCSFFCSC